MDCRTRRHDLGSYLCESVVALGGLRFLKEKEIPWGARHIKEAGFVKIKKNIIFPLTLRCVEFLNQWNFKSEIVSFVCG